MRGSYSKGGGQRNCQQCAIRAQFEYDKTPYSTPSCCRSIAVICKSRRIESKRTASKICRAETSIRISSCVQDDVVRKPRSSATGCGQHDNPARPQPWLWSIILLLNDPLHLDNMNRRIKHHGQVSFQNGLVRVNTFATPRAALTVPCVA